MEAAAPVRAASALVQRAAMRDEGLKSAARLLLVDLEKIDANLSRALEDNSKRYLARAGLRSPRWPEHQASFARLFSHAQNDEWEALNTLFDTEGFLDSKRVSELGMDRPLDVREQGWVWFASAAHTPLRREMHVLATTPWWRRRLGLTPRRVVAHNIRVAYPPLPQAVRELVEGSAPVEAQTHWDVASMTNGVRLARSMELSEEQREYIAHALER